MIIYENYQVLVGLAHRGFRINFKVVGQRVDLLKLTNLSLHTHLYDLFHIFSFICNVSFYFSPNFITVYPRDYSKLKKCLTRYFVSFNCVDLDD